MRSKGQKRGARLFVLLAFALMGLALSGTFSNAKADCCRDYWTATYGPDGLCCHRGTNCHPCVDVILN